VLPFFVADFPFGVFTPRTLVSTVKAECVLNELSLRELTLEDVFGLQVCLPPPRGLVSSGLFTIELVQSTNQTVSNVSFKK